MSVEVLLYTKHKLSCATLRLGVGLAYRDKTRCKCGVQSVTACWVGGLPHLSIGVAILVSF